MLQKGYVFAMILSTVILFSSSAYAQASPTPTPIQNVDYTLPYPGLLPDSPLYPLKAFRDRVIGFFISSPIKKANFDLLQADKRLNGSLYLFNENQNKDQLVSQTISKGENYFEDGIGQLHLAKMEGDDISGSIKTFTQAGKKHEQVLQTMEIKASPPLKTDLQQEYKRVSGFENELGKMK